MAYLHSKRYAPATIASYISAICFVFKWLGYPDPSSSFIVKKLLGATHSLNNQADIRLPITKPILHRLLAALSFVCTIRYDNIMYAAAFLLAFYAFLRIGEMTVKSRTTAYSCIQFSDVSLTSDGMLLSVVRFKSSKSQGPQFIHVAKVSKSAQCQQ